MTPPRHDNGLDASGTVATCHTHEQAATSIERRSELLEVDTVGNRRRGASRVPPGLPMPRRRRAAPTILFEFFRSVQAVRGMLATAMASSPLTAEEFAVYAAVDEWGPIKPAELSRDLEMPPTTMAHYVRDMTERGHVERLPHPTDGRSYRLVLSPAGRAACDLARSAFIVALDEFRSGLGNAEAAVEAALVAVRDSASSANDRLVNR